MSATIGSLAAGATATFVIVVDLPTGSGGTSVTNTGTVVSSTADTNTTNNAASATTTVDGADLSVSKSGDASVEVGDTISYTVTVTNIGPADAAGVTIDDVLPVGTTFVDLDPDARTSRPPHHASGRWHPVRSRP